MYMRERRRKQMLPEAYQDDIGYNECVMCDSYDDDNDDDDDDDHSRPPLMGRALARVCGPS